MMYSFIFSDNYMHFFKILTSVSFPDDGSILAEEEWTKLPSDNSRLVFDLWSTNDTGLLAAAAAAITMKITPEQKKTKKNISTQSHQEGKEILVCSVHKKFFG